MYLKNNLNIKLLNELTLLNHFNKKFKLHHSEVNDYIILLGNFNKEESFDKKKLFNVIEFLYKRKNIKDSILIDGVGLSVSLSKILILNDNIKGLKIHLNTSNDIEEILFYKNFLIYLLFVSEENIFEIQKKCNVENMSCLTVGKVVNDEYLSINDKLINLKVDDLKKIKLIN